MPTPLIMLFFDSAAPKEVRAILEARMLPVVRFTKSLRSITCFYEGSDFWAKQHFTRKDLCVLAAKSRQT
jgi:hypothetical protein